jgi:hypothetical protein
VERLLLLWDELDELVGYGRHLAAGVSFAAAHQGRRLRSTLRRLTGPAAGQIDPARIR